MNHKKYKKVFANFFGELSTKKKREKSAHI